MYNVNRPTKIRTDGSKLNGISVVVLQQNDEGEWRMVDCSSRYLTIHEKEYAPIEIEMLAISWGMKRMYMYFDLLDADALSRAPVSNPKEEDKLAEQEVEVFVNQVIRELPATEERLEQIIKETQKDETLKELMDYAKNGWPEWVAQR